MRFVVGFGLVSGFADIVYEGARSIIGPYFGSLGATAATVGVLTGVAEASALVLRLVTGPWADRTRRPWRQTLLGYLLTGTAVPLLALAGSLPVAAILYTGERVGKAVRTPARDLMLSHASAVVGRGKAFGLHEVLDRAGATIGPLLIAAALAGWHDYRWGFAVLAVPAVLAVGQLVRLRARAPDPTEWEPSAHVAETKRWRLEGGLGRPFWLYCAFTAVTMLGFATWGSVAFHLSAAGVVADGWVPVLYAAGMASGGVTALASGRLYDRVGLSGLVLVPVLSAVLAPLAFSTSVIAAVTGAILWGSVVGIQDSTMRSAVADLVPAHRRGAGYGTFSAAYGLAWMFGASVVGALSEQGTGAVTAYVGVVQAVALVGLLVLLRRR
jgi:MFS family permease